MERPLFSIITPSFRSSEWLRLCVASVADQNVSLEHIVQDSCSDDGTADWLRLDKRVAAYIEKDKGMYDAVNRGLRRAQGQFLAYINCDEQYLPGALHTVAEFFQQHPDADILFADLVVVNDDGGFACFRKVQLPSVAYTRAAGLLSTFTCSTFFRRSVLDRYDLWFDSSYRDLGDADWVIRAVRKRIPMATLRAYTTAFTFTGANMNLAPNARRERAEFMRAAPLLLRALRPLFIAQHRIRRLLDGAYHQAPFAYSIYTKANPARRHQFRVAKPVHTWPV